MKFYMFACLLAAFAAPVISEDASEQSHILDSRTSAIETPRSHSTPSFVMIARRNESRVDLLRCLFEDPNDCQVFYRASCGIRSMAISGEYIYAGLTSGGEILRCELYKKDSCTRFYKFRKSYEIDYLPVVSLAVVQGQLYAGLSNYTLFRCTLDQPTVACYRLHTFANAASGLVEYDTHLYVGTEGGKIFRCSLSADLKCIFAYDVYRPITNLAVVQNTILAGTINYGDLWLCNRTDDTIQCNFLRFRLTSNFMSVLEHHNGLLYNSRGRDEDLYVCKWINGKNCTKYGEHPGVESLAFVYSTHEMRSRYRNEHNCSTGPKCSGVTYYNVKERAAFEVHVRDGKLYNSQGVLVDTSNADDGRSGLAAIFAMGPDGQLLLSNSHKPGLIQTPSFFAGNPVSGAGEIIVKDGVIKKMTTCSKHYRVDLVLNRQVVESLRWKGYTEPIDLESCRYCDCED